MITYKTQPNHTNRLAALTIGHRLQTALDFLHNTGTHRPRRITMEALLCNRAEAITLWSLLWTDFDGIDHTEADRLREEIHSAYTNAVIRLRTKRGRTTTSA